MQLKKINRQKGFTLVEVIVIAVIVAILAAVAIPIYLNYVKSSKTNQANNIGGATASFAGACASTSGTFAFTNSSATAAGSLTCTSTAVGTTSIVLPLGFSVAGVATGAATTGTVAVTCPTASDCIAASLLTYSY